MKIDSMVREVHSNLTPYTCQLADMPVEEIKQVLGLDVVYKLSFNENPLGPSNKAIEVMKKEVERLNYYPNSAGESVIAKIAEMEGVNSSNIILANGADEMIIMIAQTFLNPKDEVIIPKLTFVQYLASTHLMGATPIITPMKEDLGIDLHAILEQITEKTKIIFLCNPNNPTGKIIPYQELKLFLEQVPEDVIVVVDEAYHEYVDSNDYASAVDVIKKMKNVFVIRTFSKIYALAAARIGYGIGAVEVVNAIQRVRPPFNVNSVAQAGALASLEDAEHRIAAKKFNEEGKSLLYKGFRDMNLNYIETNGNFVYVDIGKESKGIFQQLALKGIIVRDLSGYGLTTSLRISIGTKEELDAFLKVMNELVV